MSNECTPARCADRRRPTGGEERRPKRSPLHSGWTSGPSHRLPYYPVFTFIAGRSRDLGGFSVRRALPSTGRRLVGPFIFWDHMGPARFAPGHGIDVRPHPHINLATVTYLFEGEIVHRDSLGSDQAIQAGDVNWMTAGSGIVHSERTAAELRKAGPAMHGIQ